MRYNKCFFISSIHAYFLICLSIATYAQTAVPSGVKTDSTKISPKAKLTDTLTDQTDTITKKSNSTSGLDSEVKYTAEDSIRFDRINNIVHLYGKGRVIYKDFELDADYIRLDQKSNTVFAKGYTNPKSNRYRGKPIFKQGSEPPLTTDSLFFNYKTKKGKSYGVFSDVEGGYLQAKQFKKNEFDEGFFKNGIYSTCNLPHPHFGIHITRGIVTKKQIITGPAYLEIEDVPLPVGIPFGFFPKVNKRTSGVMLPSFGEDAGLGFFMKDLGYYIGLNDYWDMVLLGTLYSKGSFNVSDKIRYTKNYKYNGDFDLTYASMRNSAGIEGTYSNKPSKDFKIRWTHNQDPASSPGSTFGASVDAGTHGFAKNTRAGGTYNIDALTRNTLHSSIHYTKTFGMFNLSTSLSHTQNIEDKTISLTLPTFNLGMTSGINPFDSKSRVGEQKWYQKLTVGPYSVNGSNTINTFDSLLFKRESLKKFQNGVHHSVPISLSFNVLKYFQLNSSVNYSESWFLQTIRKRFGPVANGYDQVIDTISGFSRAYDYQLSSGLSTKFYGMKTFKKGRLQAIRHVVTPQISFGYNPDFTSDKFGYFRSVPTDLNGGTERYSIYEGGINQAPSSGRQAAISFSLGNNLEAKVRSKTDTVTKSEIIPILQSLNFNGSYNFAVDSFQLSEIGFNGNTAFFKQKLAINFGGSFNPYQIDKLGNRINKYTISEGKLARLTRFNISTNFSFNSETSKNRNNQLNENGENFPNATPQQKRELQSISRNPNAFVDFNVPWNISAGYNFNYSKEGLKSIISNALNFRGDLNVTPKWKVGYDSGFDFKTAKFTLPRFDIYRDLHCWDMRFSWIPIGQYKSYSVDLRVRASILQDLKLSRRSSYNGFN